MFCAESSAPQLVSMDDSDDEEDSDWTPVEAGMVCFLRCSVVADLV